METRTWFLRYFRIVGGLQGGDFLFEVLLFGLEGINAFEKRLNGCLYLFVN